MPSRHNDPHRFLVDWNGNGQFDHPMSDATEVLLEGEFTNGDDPINSPFEIVTAHAEGSVTIDNTDHRYDPDSSALQVDEVLLRRRNCCRLMAGNTLIFEALVYPEDRQPATENEPLNWTLESIQAEAIRSSDNVLIDSRITAVDSASTVASGSTVAALAQRFTQQSGIALQVPSQQPVGDVYHAGSWLEFFDDIAAFGGGWVIENKVGDFVFRRFTDTPSLPLRASLGLDYGPLNDYTILAERAGHVRNFARCRAFTWVPERDSDDNPTEVLLQTKTLRVEPDTVNIVNLTFTQTLQRRVVTWGPRYEVAQGDGFAVIVGTPAVSPDNTSVAITVRSQPFDDPYDITVNAYGTAELRKEAEPVELNISEFETQATYGQRELDIPSWFRTDFLGVATFTRPFLRNLSQPREHFTMAYRSLQATAGRAEIMYGIDTGDAAEFATVVGEEPHTVDGLVLQKTIVWDQNEATHIFRGVRRRAVPPAPLTAEVTNITDISVQVSLLVPSPAGETIYAQQKNHASVLWQVDLPERQATTETVNYQITGLRAKRNYDFRFSTTPDFSSNVAEIGPVRTLLEDTRVRLGEVTVNGNAISGWDRALDTDFETTTAFPTAAFEHEVTVAAEPVDSNASVTVTPPTQSGPDRETLRFVITVTLGDLSRVYTLEVTIQAPFAYEFNNLPSGASVPKPTLQQLRDAGGTIPFSRLTPTDIAASSDTMYIASGANFEYFEGSQSIPGRPGTPAVPDQTRTNSVSQLFAIQNAANNYVVTLRSTVASLVQGTFTSGPTVTSVTSGGSPGTPDEVSTQSVTNVFSDRAGADN